MNGKYWSYPRYKPSGKTSDKHYVDFPDPQEYLFGFFVLPIIDPPSVKLEQM
jgi:hypothetical protein